MKKILLITIFLLNCSYAQVSIDAGLYNENIKQLFINDLDLIQKGTSPLIFWLRFDNSQPTAANVYLKLSFTYVDRFKSQVRELLRGKTQPIEIPSAGLSLTNQDIFSGNGSYKLRDYGIDREAADDIMDYILSTGKIPSGRYEFMLRIFDSNNHSRLDETVIELEISDQISIDLISPGEKADISHLTEIYTKLPHFRWESNATRFRLRVCEKLPGNNSPKEVMNNTPRFEKIIENQKTLQYPAAGAFPLEIGCAYFWQITALVASANSTIEYPSEIWGFKIADIQQSILDSKHAQILNYLRILLGDDKYEQLFGENGKLENYRSTGIVRKNGTHLSLQHLNQLFTKFSTDELQVTNFNVE